MSTNKTNQATPPGQKMDLNPNRMNTGTSLPGNRPNLPEDPSSKPSPHHGPKRSLSVKTPVIWDKLFHPCQKMIVANKSRLPTL